MVFRLLFLYSLCAVSVSAGIITLNGIVRDFCAPSIPGSCTQLADFEGAITGVVTGMVSSTLNGSGLPDYVGGGTGATTSSNFAKWYVDSPGFNLSTPISLTLTETFPGSGVFSYSNGAFFPIDNQLWGNQSRSNNFHFTMRLHGQTRFTATDTFSFSGDDDLWIYIGGRLVMDLGGVHTVASQTITGADLLARGLLADTTYDLDIFFAERHTVASNFFITTSFRVDSPVNPGIQDSVPESSTAWLVGLPVIAIVAVRRGAKNHRRSAAGR